MRSLTHPERLKAERIDNSRKVGTKIYDIIQEMLLATGLERQGRSIDKGQSASLEDKKAEGYFI